jgi:hypothetical protein
MKVTVRERTTAGATLATLELQLDAAIVTVAELIRARVQEGHDTEPALQAFERGRVLLLVDDRQVERLDEEIVLAPDTTVTFLELVPLAGG